MGGLLCLWGSFFSAEKRKACFLPATRKRLFANSDFVLQQRAEGFQRAIGKPFGRLRRGEILCDAGRRKVGPFPACRKEAVLYTNFCLQQRAEGFQRAIGKPFGRLRRGEILCDAGRRKVGPFPACRKEAVLYTNFYLLQRAEGFQRATGKPFGRLRRGEILCDAEKKGRPFSCLPQEVCFSWEVLPTHIGMGPKGSRGRSESPWSPPQRRNPL